MAPGVTVVAGPARSGKTDRLLVEYRQVLADGEPGRAVWIAPTRRSAAELRGRLLTRQLRACFAPGVITFDEFAENVLQPRTYRQAEASAYRQDQQESKRTRRSAPSSQAQAGRNERGRGAGTAR